MDPARAWPADGRLHPPLWLEDERTPDMTVAWQTAAVAVGLPPATDWERPTGCLAGGQARLVLAHLLAGRATATTAEALRRKADHVRDEHAGASRCRWTCSTTTASRPPPPEAEPARKDELVSADGRTRT